MSTAIIDTAIIDTGCANIASVRFALDRLGADYRMAKTPDEAADAQRLILPGVGSAGPAMTQLRASGWADALQDDTRPLLGICLGMQMLFERSAEDDVDCLGLIPGRIERLPSDPALTWPHMGWNTLERLDPSEPLLAGVETGSYVYFVHGYFKSAGRAAVAETSYGADIAAMVRHGHVAGCQFHPERSAATGARILGNFLEQAA